MSEFPNRINELRRAMNLSQEALAERMNTSKMNVSRYESGTAELRLSWMRRFARALNCSPADLLLPQDNPDALSGDERELVVRYRSADEDRKDDLKRVAETLVPFKSFNNNAA